MLPCSWLPALPRPPTSPIEPIVAPLAASAFNWTGFYAGAQLGYGWGNDTTVELATGPNTPTGLAYELPSQGPLGGIFAGYNHQMNSIVIGGEADIEAADIRGDFGDEITGLGAGASHIDWQGSVRARLGFTASDRALGYLTGGVAFANINYVYSRTALIPPAVDEPVTNFRAGWTVGAGLEYALTDNVTLRGEYRYADYGTFHNESKVAFGPGVPIIPPGRVDGRTTSDDKHRAPGHCLQVLISFPHASPRHRTPETSGFREACSPLASLTC